MANHYKKKLVVYSDDSDDETVTDNDKDEGEIFRVGCDLRNDRFLM